MVFYSFLCNIKIHITGFQKPGKEGLMAKNKKTKTTIYTSKKKRAAAAVVCILLAAAMLLPMLLSAFV